ncbi:MAG: NAD(+)/NADH kinase [Firmicutes bacterium]|nr:NAD(+)/NADH kinase [Bacillota bacterium]
MRIGIYSNLNKDGGCAVTKRLIAALEGGGFSYILHEAAAAALKQPGQPVDGLIEGSDTIVTIGGDGTILSVAARAARAGRKLLGVNLGRCGFLAETAPDEIEAAIEKLAARQFAIEERSVLKVDYCGLTGYALNEMAVHRKPGGRLVDVRAYSDGSFVDRYYADGFIVATPTGSTAYALSAGGPILSPGVKAFLLLPICSHALHNKPIAVPDGEKIAIAPASDDFECCLALDGIPFSAGKMSDIRIEKADFNALFIRFSKHDFYERLFGKLNDWSQGK